MIRIKRGQVPLSQTYYFFGFFSGFYYRKHLITDHLETEKRVASSFLEDATLASELGCLSDLSDCIFINPWQIGRQLCLVHKCGKLRNHF